MYIAKLIINFLLFQSEPTTPSSMISSAYSLGHVRRRGKDRGIKELHAMWYPTVRRTLMCFSKLYRCLEVNSNSYVVKFKVHIIIK